MSKPISAAAANKLRGSRFMPFLVCLALAGLALGLFWPVASCGFLNYDDPDYVAENFHVRQGFAWSNLVWAFTNTETGNWHPLTWLLHFCAWKIFSGWAGGHHLVNVAFHVANAVLLFLFLKRASGSMARSALVALFFAIHPSRVESVAWVSELKDVSSTFFLFCALLAYAGYVTRGSRTDWKSGG